MLSHSYHSDVITPGGVKVSREIRVYKRKGWKAPISIYIKDWDDKWISPFEQRIRGWKLGVSTLFKAIYSPQNIAHLIYDTNPLLKRIK